MQPAERLPGPSMPQERATISYCISGMAAREQLVFKSLMRLLSPRLTHAWVYAPQGELAVVGNPPVLGDDLSLESHLLIKKEAQTVLSVGTDKHHDIRHLQLPIQANVMEVQLNSLGDEIAAARMLSEQQAANSHARQSMQTQPLIVAVAQTPQAVQSITLDFAGKVSLKRWPSKNLLRHTTHIRMATILLRPQTSVQDFLKLHAPTPELGLQFLQDLQALDFLKIESQAITPQATPQPLPATAQPQAQSKAPATPALSLLSRIRQRLGI